MEYDNLGQQSDDELRSFDSENETDLSVPNEGHSERALQAIEERLVYYCRTVVRMDRRLAIMRKDPTISGADLSRVYQTMNCLGARAQGLDEALRIIKGEQVDEQEWVTNALDEFGPRPPIQQNS